jgi:hypothetical protein
VPGRGRPLRDDPPENNGVRCRDENRSQSRRSVLPLLLRQLLGHLPGGSIFPASREKGDTNCRAEPISLAASVRHCGRVNLDLPGCRPGTGAALSAAVAIARLLGGGASVLGVLAAPGGLSTASGGRERSLMGCWTCWTARSGGDAGAGTRSDGPGREFRSDRRQRNFGGTDRVRGSNGRSVASVCSVSAHSRNFLARSFAAGDTVLTNDSTPGIGYRIAEKPPPGE